MRRLTTALVLALALALPAAPSALAAPDVNIEDGGYNPAKIVIAPGASVVWHYANTTTAHGVQIDTPSGPNVVCAKTTQLLGTTPDCTSQPFSDPARVTYHDVGCDPSTDPTCISGQIVVYVPPTASFTASPTTLNRGGTVNFDASASTAPGGSITNYAWDFGDGTTGSGATTSHAYAGAGAYTAKLTVTDDQSNVAIATQAIQVDVPDSDGDGLNDDLDACPAVAAPGTPHGCPVPPIKASISRAPVLGLAGVLKSGIATVLHCSDACSAAYSLTLNGLPVGSATGALLGPGSQLVVVNVDPAAKGALLRAARPKLVLKATLTDALGRTQTLQTSFQIANVKTYGRLPAIGISDEQATTFGDPLFQVLRLKYARLVTPWNAIFSEPQRLDAWLQAARAAGARPLVSFGHKRSERCPKRPCKPPSVGQYKRAWRAFHKKYPWVKDISPWNEVNSNTQPTGRRPDLAAAYYNTVRASCRGCSIVAADVLDLNNMRRYLYAFLAKAKGKPRLWGLHNYRDTNRFRQTGTRQLLATVKGQVWFTETGGIVSFKTQGGKTALPKSEARAEKAMAFMFKLAEIDSKRVKRIYVYQWKVNFKGDRFDAGVVRPDGSPRPSFDVLALNASIARKR